MKTKIFISTFLLIAVTLIFFSCKKEKNNNTYTPDGPPYGPVVNNYNAGLGNNPGYPTGTVYTLPSHIKIIGEIRGGLPYRNYIIDKNKFSGPFPYTLPEKNWIEYGTGTFVNLYIKLYNTNPIPTSVTFPGGLIFVDSLDANTHVGTYQKGYILQNIEVPIPALDTAFACLRAYCLNHDLLPSNYDAIYFIGPVTNNPELNTITNIMSTKQYPFGEEYNIQQIIWNVTDYGMTLTQAEIQYLNSLP